MTWGAVAIGGASLVGSALGASGASSAARKQARAQRRQLKYLKAKEARTRADFKPYMEAGLRGLPMYEDELARYRRDQKPFEFSFDESDPSYQFRFAQGQQATDRAMRARGGLASGGRLLALQQYGQQAASQEYQAEFQRDMAAYKLNQAGMIDRLNAIKGLSDYGLSAAAQSAAATQPLVSQAGQTMADIGATKAAGVMGVTNSVVGGLRDFSYLSGLNSQRNYIAGGGSSGGMGMASSSNPGGLMYNF